MSVFTFGASYIGDNSFFGLAMSELSNDYGIPAGSHEHDHEEEHGDDHDDDHDDGEEEEEEENVRLDIEQTRYDLRGGLTNLDGILDEIRLAVTYSDYQHIELEGAEQGTKFSNESTEGRLEIVHDKIGDFTGAVGLQYEDSDFAAVGEEAFIPETNTESFGLFVVEDLHVGEDVYEFGLRFDRDEYDAKSGESESFDSVSLSIAGHWAVDENWHLGAALSSAERAPVVEELYSNITNQPGEYVVHIATDAIEVGDSNLTNERSDNLDISVHYHTDNLDVNLSFYYNDFNDYIYLANGNMEQDETDVYFYLQEDAKFYGVEFDITTELGQALGGGFELRIFGDTITGELDNGSDVPRLPPMRIGSELGFATESFSSYISVLNASDQNNAGDFENETEGYTRWDAGMDYRFGDIDDGNILVFLKLKNITDEEIRSSVSVLRDVAPEAGRSVEAGVRFSF
jgi:iron complex outermembrane receptor protein